MTTGPLARHDAQSEMSLNSVFAIFVRRWRTIAVCILGMVVATSVYILMAPPLYSSRAVVAVNVLPDNPLSTTVDSRNFSAQTEVSVATSSSVAELAAARIGNGATARELLNSISVTSPLNSQVLVLEYTAGTAKAAATGVNAYALAYLDHRRDTFLQQAEEVRASLAQRIETLQKQADQQSALMTSSAATKSQRLDAEALLTSLRQQISDARIDEGRAASTFNSPGYQVDRGDVPSTPSSPRPLLYLMVSALIGALLGLAVAVYRDRNDRGVTGPDHLQALLPARLLGNIPAASRRSRAATPIGEDVERCYHTVAGKILNLTQVPDLGGGLLLVCAGKSAGPYSAIALARSFAAAGFDVRLAGTTEGIKSAWRVEEALPFHDFTGRGTPVEPVAPGASGTVVLDNLGYDDDIVLEVTRRLRDPAAAPAPGQITIIDGINVADDVTVASLTRLARQAVIFVVQRQTRAEEVVRLARELDDLGTDVVGAVLLVPETIGSARTRRRPRRKRQKSFKHVSAQSDPLEPMPWSDWSDGESSKTPAVHGDAPENSPATSTEKSTAAPTWAAPAKPAVADVPPGHVNGSGPAVAPQTGDVQPLPVMRKQGAPAGQDAQEQVPVVATEAGRDA